MDNIIIDCSELTTTKKSTRLGNFWAENDQSPPSEKVGKDILESQLDAENLDEQLVFAQDILNDPETMAFTGELSKLCWGIVTSDQVILINLDESSFTNPALTR